jgi:hypothetical protein
MIFKGCGIRNASVMAKGSEGLMMYSQSNFRRLKNAKSPYSSLA